MASTRKPSGGAGKGAGRAATTLPAGLAKHREMRRLRADVKRAALHQRPEYRGSANTHEELRAALLTKFTEALDEELKKLHPGHRLRFFFRFEIVSDRPDYDLRAFVLARAGHRCENCGAVEYLHVHHVKSFAEHEDLRHDPENLRVLCRDCHADEHPGLASLIRSIHGGR